MVKPTIHLPGLFHTRLTHEFDHCAFSTKVWKFSKMMQMQGWRVIEYSNSPSESECAEKVEMLTKDELDKFCPRKATDFHGNYAVIGSPHWRLFDERFRAALKERVKPGDFIVHPFGRSHMGIVKEFPQQKHGEFSAIGYPDKDFGAFRVFETESWRHFHAGGHLNFDGEGRVIMQDNVPRVGRNGSMYEWTNPNYYDMKDWTTRTEPGKYLLFYHRICHEKGMDTIKAIAEKIDEQIIVAGQGDMKPWGHKNLKYIGPVSGSARNELLGNAKAILCPTVFFEPFCGSSVEAMICGTPAITSPYGSFTETIEHGKTGYRCHVLGDWLQAIRRIPTLDRAYISERARRLYSLETCGAKVDKILRQIMALSDKGWYSEESIWVD